MRELDLSGNGAAYIRVSKEDQETDRQHESIASFQKRHEVKIPKNRVFKDEGWARDTADERPGFQSLIKLAEAGQVQWIVVDKLDRFAAKNSDHFITYRHRLREAGCKLFDVSGKEWTAADIGTTIAATIEADNAQKEQISLSRRVSGAKAAQSKAGRYQGGPVRLGFDVACIDSNGKERWRVVYEGKQGTKVYPDGRREEYTGKGKGDLLRLTRSKDEATLDAVRRIFERYATESVGPTELAKELRAQGFTNAFGAAFKGLQVEEMLRDPAYIGRPAYAKRHAGKFSRWKDGSVHELERANHKCRQSRNKKSDWVMPDQPIFEPIIDAKTWEAVQAKLESKVTRPKAPKAPDAYLSGLIHCSNCGEPMVAQCNNGKRTYICRTYHRHAVNGTVRESSCKRHGVLAHNLEPLLADWVDEASRTLADLNDESVNLAPIEREKSLALMRYYFDIQQPMEEYLERFHPGKYNAWDENDSPREKFSKLFDPRHIERELTPLQREYDALAEKALNLDKRATRAIARVNDQLAGLQAELDRLEALRDNITVKADEAWEEIRSLSKALKDARQALKGRPNRIRAERLRRVIGRIDCAFSEGRLAGVTVYPVSGESAPAVSESSGIVLYDNAHSCKPCTTLPLLAIFLGRRYVPAA